jgi:signal transduction histidine kinase
MRGLERIGRRGWRWVALFTVLVVLPAIALTLLSIRAFQGEASRAAFQRRERQQQVLRLLENDLRDWVLSLDRGRPAAGAIDVFEVRDSGVFLPRLNVFLSPGHDRATEIRLSVKEAAFWQQARAAESSGEARATSAAAAYRALLAEGPPLAPWARLALLRLSLQQRDCAGAAALLAAIRQKDQAAVTESGIPVWVASALLIKDAGSACPSEGATQFLATTLNELQRSRWPLTAAQWIYYVRELLSVADPGPPSTADFHATASFLESLESALPDVLALHQNRERRQSYPLAARYVPALQAVAVLVPRGDVDAGRVLPADRFQAEAARRLGVLTVAEDFEGRLAPLDDPAPPSTALLPAFPFLQVSFVEKIQPLWRAHLRRYLTFYMTAVLLVIAGVGLALIYRTVAREVEVSRMKADFVSSVSHEFRTPLAAIDALLERLESGKARDAEMRQRYYRASRQEVHRLTRMVNQLLSLARLDQGREQFAREMFELNEPAGEVVQSFGDLGFGARLVVSLDAEQEHRVLADRTATYQCVHNLVDNALKYSPADGSVTVRTGRADSFAFVEVEDRGPGIPAAEQPLVFEQFYRGPGAQSSGVQGAGIGLAYVKKVMEAHGGRVTLESRPGAGSTFRLSFPDGPHTTHPEEAREPRP